MRILWTYLCLLAGLVAAQAQVYPVSAQLTVLPPHSPYLYTLSDPTPAGLRSNALRLSLRLNDLQEPSVDVRLHWELSGPGATYRSIDTYLPRPATLLPGQVVLLESPDLAEYFSPRALGLQTLDAVLREGLYTLCVTVHEYRRNVPISAPACALLPVVEHDPPVLLQPEGQVDPLRPQYLPFSWQPRHFGVFPVTYQLRIWEELPGWSPELVTTSTFPVFTTEVQQATAFVYGPAEPPLQRGKSYWVQVQARADGQLFKNNGRSPVYRFTYGLPLTPQSDCGYLTSLRDTLRSTRSTGLRWSGGGGPYFLHWRETGAADWQVLDTDDPFAQLNELRRGGRYEAFVEKSCSGDRLLRSDTIAFKLPNLPPARDFVCGQPLNGDPDWSPVPLDELFTGDTVLAGDFRVVILEARGGGGVFSGRGYLQLPVWGGPRIEIAFASVSINEDYYLTGGEMESVYDANWSNVANLDSLLAGWSNPDRLPIPEYQLDERIDSVVVDGDQILVYTADGNVHRYDQPALISGTGGGSYVVLGGIVMQVLEDLPEEPETLAEVGRAYFLPDPGMQFGIDLPVDGAQGYRQVRDYRIGWKSVATGAADPIRAVVQLSSRIWRDSVRVLTASGLLVPHEWLGGDTLRTHVTGRGLEEDLYIEVRSEGIIGVIGVVDYVPTALEVVLISINNAVADAEQLEAQTNKLLAQGVVRSKISRFDFQLSDTDPDGEIQAGRELLSSYTADMLRVIRAFRSRYEPQSNTAYIFLTDNLQGQVLGYMPRGKGFGFLDVRKQHPGGLGGTLAHELGHGFFQLPHAWEQYPEYEEGQSPNLMDWGAGGQLRKEQWDRMHRPGLVLSFLEEGEDGMNLAVGTLDYYCIKPPIKLLLQNAGYDYFDLNGQVITLAELGEPLAFAGPDEKPAIRGALVSFNQANTPFGPLVKFSNNTESGQQYQYNGYFSTFTEPRLLERPGSGNASKAIRLHPENETAVIVDASGNEIQRIQVAFESCPFDVEKSENAGPLIEDGLSSTEIFKIFSAGMQESDPRIQGIWELIAHIKSLIAGSKAALYAEFEVDTPEQFLYHAANKQEGSFFEALKKQGIFKVQDFDKIFSRYTYPEDDPFQIRDVTVLISNVDLWEGVDPGYNAHVVDYASYPTPSLQGLTKRDTQEILQILNWLDEFRKFQLTESPTILTLKEQSNLLEYLSIYRENPAAVLEHRLGHRLYFVAALQRLGAFEPYQYGIEELITRRKTRFQGGALWTAILQAEREGRAMPITADAEYANYLARYDTESAFFIGREYLRMYIEELFEPDMAMEAIARAQAILSKSARKFGKSLDEAVQAIKLSSDISDLELARIGQLLGKPKEEVIQFLQKTGLQQPELGQFVGDLNDKDLVTFYFNDISSIKIWEDISQLPKAFRTDILNLKQKKIINQYGNNISSETNLRKGNFGEIGADLDLNRRGYKSLHNRVVDIDDTGHHGIDGVFEKNGNYYIVEGKYSGSASLSPANPATGLPRQMSDQWIDRDIQNILGPNLGQTLSATRNYSRILAKVDSNGNVTYSLIDSNGYVILGNRGIFNP